MPSPWPPGGGGSGGPPDTVAPTIPTNLTATVSDRRVSLTWDPATDDNSGVHHYVVRRDGTRVN